jgi:hypothetical protein
MARAASPMTVPRPQGTAKIANAAKSYPGTVAPTSVAKDFCQNAVSYLLSVTVVLELNWLAETYHKDKCQVAKPQH